ncbi:uncharacterized protein DDB_G0290685-like isoform X2 [Hemiscyllium ocellatum]|uniref:uncharacterized protein DDB_G0290685-like isoform X2 n=1 Tax=Hemiscyllium ocellatum TaxID=170820 RepID=UPI002966DA5A|nr:uncharacterized protein DDB_G0290685-like isoform X2 [Hemiscyllium ocellatum]
MENSSHNCKPRRRSFNLSDFMIKFKMSRSAVSHEEYFGLYNQGATCYLNTLLQTLYMTPEVKDTIDKFVGERYEPIDKDASICYQLKDLFASLKNRTAHTHGITRTLGLSKKVFEQQDIEEYFRLLLNKIDEESNGSCNVLQIYQSKVINSLKCLECDTESQKECTLLDIPLSLSPPDCITGKYFNSVNESLQEFLKETILSGDNLCYCERCEKKTGTKTVRGTDKTEWRFLPNGKPTQLDPGSSHVNDESNVSCNLQEDKDQEGKPTQLDPGSSHVNDESNVSCNLQEDKDQENIPCGRTCSDGPERGYVAGHSMAEHFTGGTVKGTGVTATQLDPGSSHGNDESNASQNPQEDKDQEEYAIYELFASCNHSGIYDSGHYVADIKPISSCKWYCFNDAFVRKEKDTSEESSGGGSNISSRRSSTAYLLMYRKEEVNSNQGVIADQGQQRNEQMEMRESSPFVIGATNHDFGQNNPTSDQNTEDLTENIDAKMNEGKGTVETLEENSSELMKNGSLLHQTDGKEGGNADVVVKWNEEKRVRKSSGTGNEVNSHDIREYTLSSDQNIEHSPESSNAVINEEHGIMKDIETMVEPKEREKQTGETEWNKGGNADVVGKWNEEKRVRKSSGTGNEVNSYDIREHIPPSDQNIEHSPESSNAVIKEEHRIMKDIETTVEPKEREKQTGETEWNKGGNADVVGKWNEEKRVRKSSGTGNEVNSYDIREHIPPSDQNIEHSPESSNAVIKEEHRIMKDIETTVEPKEREKQTGETEWNKGGNADVVGKWNEEKRVRKSSGTGNEVNSYDIREHIPPSDQNIEHSPESSNAVIKEEHRIMKDIETTVEPKEREKQTGETEWNKGGNADVVGKWNEEKRVRKSSGTGNEVNSHDIREHIPPCDQNIEHSPESSNAVIKEEHRIMKDIETTVEPKEREKQTGETEWNKGGNADVVGKWNEEKRVRKSSGTGNEVNSYDIREHIPPSDQNIEHSPESSNAVIKEEHRIMKDIETTVEPKEREKQTGETEWNKGGNADADGNGNELKRMRKNSGTGNKVNNHGIRQGNPSSDSHTEHSPESSDAVMKWKQESMKNMGMACEPKEKEKQIEETDCKED